MVTCGACARELASDARFCDGCGTPVGPAAAPLVPTAPASEAVRKIVTVMFADLGGSTGFGERTDPETARVVMARYHSTMREVVEEHGGRVAKFIGDGVMALWGIPEIAEDDAARAVTAGAAMQARFVAFADDIAERHGERLTFRVGINTGEVVIAAGDADMVGDALNVAARLEKACEPGRVLVGEETWRLTRGLLHYEPLGDVTVSGRAEPVSIFRLAEGAATPIDAPTPFVGRDRELGRLVTACADAVEQRSPRFVTVLGSPGVGKTRLARELIGSVGADTRSFELRCDRAGEATFAPIVDLIRTATNLGDGVDADGTRVALASLLRADGERDRIVDGLAGLVGTAPARSTEETFWAVRRLVEALARTGAVVIVIDDIQWAESLLLDLLEHLAEWVSDAAFMLVGLARPELREIRSSLTEIARPMADVIALDGLDSAATAELAGRLLDTDRLPVEIVERLPASTDGNPLFVRELVRMLVDDHIIEERGGAWELAIDADAIEVPPTIQSLLAARVERLPDDERVVLELASVIGYEFNLGALRDLVEPAERPALAGRLERLRRKELIEPTGAYWGNEPVHRFHHVLIRDATYRRLLKAKRADVHERVGRWTDAAAADVIGEHEAAIAYHYEQAQNFHRELGTLDDHGRGLGRRAAELLTIAAGRALEREDLAAAAGLATRAVALAGPDKTVAVPALLIACESLLASGEARRATPLVEDLTDMALGDARLGAWADCFTAQMIALTDPDRLAEAEALTTSASLVLHDLDDLAGAAKAHHVRASVMARLGRVGECEAELDAALAAARAVDDHRRVTAVLGAAPAAALWGPSPLARAGGRCLDVVRLLRITGASPSVEASSMRSQALIEALRGRVDVARAMIERSRAALEELGLHSGLLEADLFAGIIELTADDAAAAEPPLRAAYHGLGSLGVGADAGLAAALLSGAVLTQGRVDEADELASASQAMAGQNLKTAIAWRAARARIASARGDHAGAVTIAEEAVRIAAPTDLLLDHAEACVALATVRAAAGDTDWAEQAAREAAALYQRKGATTLAQRLSGPSTAAEPAPSAPTAKPTPADPTPGPDDLATHPRHPAHGTETVDASAGTTRAGGAASASAWWLSVANAATAAMERADLAGGEREAVLEQFADPYERIDRRTGPGGHPIASAAQWVDVLLSYLAVGFQPRPPEPLCVRGERLALFRMAARTEAGDEVSSLSLYELNADGRFVRNIDFDDDHHGLVAAQLELFERYAAGEGAEVADKIASHASYYEQRARGDWVAFESMLDDGLIFVDHRPLGWGTGDAKTWLHLERSHFEVVPDLVVIEQTMSCRNGVAIFLSDNVGTTPEGNVSAKTVVAVGSDYPASGGNPRRVELFDPDDIAGVSAHLRDLGIEGDDHHRLATVPIAGASVLTGPAARHPRTENRAAESFTAYNQLLGAGRYEALDRFLAEDFVRIDRRHGINAPTIVGAAEYVAAQSALADVGLRFVSFTPMAVRGECHVLARVLWAADAGDELPLLVVIECDEAGRGRRVVFFDDDDLVSALGELEDRYVAGEGAGDAVAIRASGRYHRAFLERDFDAIEALLTPDFVVVDHRTLGFGTQDRAGWLERDRSQVEVAPDAVNVPRKLWVSGGVLLTCEDSYGSTTDGNRYEWPVHTVGTVDDAGHCDRIELFADEDFDAAVARFDELRRS